MPKGRLLYTELERQLARANKELAALREECDTSRAGTDQNKDEAAADAAMLFNRMIDGFALHEIILDANGAPSDYRFLAVNPAFERMTGIRAESITGKTVLEVFPQTEFYWIERYGRVALTGAPDTFEEYTVSFDKWFEVTAYCPGHNQFACIFADITERKRAQQALIERERQFRTLVESSPDFIMRYDRQGRHLFMNAAALRVAGLTEADVLGKTHREAGFPPDLSAFWEQSIADVFETGRPFATEFDWDSVEGAMTLDWRLTPEFDGEGNIESVLGVARDVTALHKASADLRLAFERAQAETNAMAWIVSDPSIANGDIPALAKIITEMAAQVLRIERVSLWLFDEPCENLVCLQLYEKTPHRFSSGGILKAEQYGSEFAALETVKYIAADRAMDEPRMAGYVEGYIKPVGITAMLDAVVRASGRNLGALCFEQTGKPHHWEQDEITFACQLADQVAIAILNNDRRRAEGELRESEEAVRTCLALYDEMFDLSEQEMIVEGLEDAARLAQSEIGFFHFVDEASGELTLSAWSRKARDVCSTNGIDRHYPIAKAGVWADCIHTRQPVFHNDFSAMAHRKGYPEGHVRILREMVVPVLDQGKIVAVLGVGNKASDYTDRDAARVTLIAQTIWRITMRKRAETNIQNVNAALRTLRVIDLLITGETDAARLVRGVCRTLSESRGCLLAWIAMMDEDGGIQSFEFQGNGENTAAFKQMLEEEQRPPCLEFAHESQRPCLFDNLSKRCALCPIYQRCQNWGAIVCQLAHGGRRFGLLGIALAQPPDESDEEVAFYAQIAGDLSLALHDLATEKQRRLEEETRRLYEHIVTAADNPMAFMDEMLRYRAVNDAFLQLYGVTREEVLGQTPSALMSRERFELVRPRFLRCLSGEHVQYESWIEFPKFGLRLLQVNLIPYNGAEEYRGVIFILADITDLKLTKEWLATSEYLYHEMFEHIGSGVIICKDLKGGEDFSVQDINPAGLRIINRSGEKLAGKPLSEILPSFAANGMMPLLQRVWRSRAPLHLKEAHYEDAAIAFWFEGYVSYLTSGHLVLVFEDITERKTAEAKHHYLENQLLQSQKMEAIGTLAGGIAHDFNNILGAILGFSELALEDAAGDERISRSVAGILKASKRAQALVKQILSFSRQSEHTRQPIRLQSLVKETVKMLRGSIPATIDIESHVSPACGTVLADTNQIHQVLMNLCTNAYHAMRGFAGRQDKEHRSCVLTIRLVPEEMPAETGTDATPKSYILLSVSDTGLGVDPAVMDRIFDPYFTTKPKGDGTGLGLAMVHNIVAMHEGFIEVDNHPGKGVEFRVHLPVVEDADVSELERNPLPQTGVHGAERILFVDDELDILFVNKSGLERLGYRVTTCLHPVAALELFQSDPRAFDLVITDFTMPGMTGLEMGKRLLVMRPDMPILLCTGYSENVDADTALKQGFAAFMLKPMTAADLALKIREILDR